MYLFLVFLFRTIDLFEIILSRDGAGYLLLRSSGWATGLGCLVSALVVLAILGWSFVVLSVCGVVVVVLAFDIFFVVAGGCWLFSSSFLGLGSWSDR